MSKTQAGPIAAKTDGEKIGDFADRLTKLADDYRDDVATVMGEVKKADLDPGALKRFVSWLRMDAVKRAEREALDEQYRFLAGMTETPAALPTEGELVQAVRFYRDKLTVRQVAN